MVGERVRVMLIGAAGCGETDKKEDRGAAVLLFVGCCELLLSWGCVAAADRMRMRKLLAAVWR